MKRNWIPFVGLSILLLFACSPDSQYHKMLETEMASGVRYDSLFLGIYFGMPSKNFYAHCWKLNKEGIIREGANNTSVNYPIQSFKEPASMDFYPRFVNDKIVEMPVYFAYKSWSPWNKDLFAEHLIIEVRQLMEEWYGPGFIEIPNPGPLGGNAYVKVNGNRRISIYYKDDTRVRVDFVDLLAKQELEHATP
ncbi:MAG: hypothetical protein AAF587_42950 [Bacteroidota bacterium]